MEGKLPNKSMGTQVDQNHNCTFPMKISWTRSALRCLWLHGPAHPGHGSVMIFQATFMEARGRMAGLTQELCYPCCEAVVAVPAPGWWALNHFCAWCRPQNSASRQLGSEEKPVMCMWLNGANCPQGWRADLLISIVVLDFGNHWIYNYIQHQQGSLCLGQ